MQTKSKPGPLGCWIQYQFPVHMEDWESLLFLWVHPLINKPFLLLHSGLFWNSFCMSTKGYEFSIILSKIEASQSFTLITYSNSPYLLIYHFLLINVIHKLLRSIQKSSRILSLALYNCILAQLNWNGWFVGLLKGMQCSGSSKRGQVMMHDSVSFELPSGHQYAINQACGFYEYYLILSLVVSS